MQAVAQGEVALLGQGFLRQADLALGIEASHIAHIVGRPPIGLGNHLDIRLPEQADQVAHHLGQLVDVVQRRHGIVVPLDIGHLHHQHRMMGGHRAAALGEDVRMRQALLVAEFAQHLHHGARIFEDVIVDRAGIARVGAVVIDAQATAHVDMIDRQPQRPQLAKVADRLAKTVLVIRQVGNLRPHMEMQQAYPSFKPGAAELIHHPQQLRRRQTEFGFLPAGIRPLAGRQGRQAHPQAHLGRQPEGRGFLDHQRDLGFLLDNNEDVVAQLLPEQRQADELPVLVTVADDGTALGRHGQHRHELGLGAGFQADGHVLGRNDVLDHRFLLVDLDRVQGGVAAGIVQLGDILLEGAGQLPHPVLEDVGKAQQQG